MFAKSRHHARSEKFRWSRIWRRVRFGDERAGRVSRYVQLFVEPLEERALLSASIFGTVYDSLLASDAPLANVPVYLDPTVTVAAASTAITSAAAGLFAPYGGFASTLQVTDFPAQIEDVSVNMVLTNNGTDPVQVGLVSPLGYTDPNNANMFNILPGETFAGSFDDNAANSEAAVNGFLPPGTYRPQQYFTDPQAHVFDGTPNGTWGLIFFPPAGQGDINQLTLSSWSLTFTLPGASAQTDANGNYSFTGVQAGIYEVTLSAPPAAAQTFAAAANVSQPVSVATNETVTGINLGVQPAPSPTPIPFNPTNTAVDDAPGTQNSPSIAVDPNKPNEQVVAFMDYAPQTPGYVVEPGYAGIGIEVSTDGGQTWSYNSIPLPAGFTGGAADPKVSFDNDGHVYVSFMAATYLGGQQPDETDPEGTQRYLGFTSNNGIFVAQGDVQGDGSVAWNAPVAVTENLYTGNDVPFNVMPDSEVDSNGNIYVTWATFYPSGQFPGPDPNINNSQIMLAVSSDGGANWTTRLQNENGIEVSTIQDPNYYAQDAGSAGRGFLAYPAIAIGPAGDVYVATYSGGNFAVFHSFDGGTTFTPPNYLYNISLPFFQQGGTADPNSEFNSYPDNFPTVPIRDIVADPAHAGRVYVATSMAIYDPPVTGTDDIVDIGDIVFARSDDYGLTWQHLFTVGADPSYLDSANPLENDNILPILNDDNDGQFIGFDQEFENDEISDQMMPAMAVDAQGDLVIIWYDTRRNPESNIDTEGDPGGLLDIFGTVSTDGGLTFTPNFRVTNVSFDPNQGAFTNGNGNTDFFLGNAIGVAAADGSAYAVWTDTRNGDQDIYSQAFPIEQTVPAAPVDRFSPNFTQATATPLGQISAQQVFPKLALAPGSSAEWFSLQAGATGQLLVSVAASSPGSTPTIVITDANGTPVTGSVVTDVFDSSGNVIGEEIGIPSISGETYWIDVQGDSTAGIAYTLSAQSLTADLGTQVEGAESDTVEGGSQNLYLLATAVAGTLQVSLNAGSDVQGNLNLAILASDGQTVLAADQPAGVGPDQSETLSIAVTQGQTVFLDVAGYNLTSAQGSFTLQFTNLDQFEATGITTAFIPTEGTPTSLAVAALDGSDNPPSLLVANTDASDTLGVLTSNGNGTFQAETQYAVGPGLAGNLNAGARQIQVADLTGSGVPDVIVPNFNAADVSVLLGNGNGTLQPEREFDAVGSPTSIVTGQFTSSGLTDAIVLQNFAQSEGGASFAYLRSLGGGIFAPPVLYQTIFTRGATSMVTGDFTGDGKLDLIVLSFNDSQAELFLGNGDGTFQAGHVFSIPEATFAAQAVDLTGNGILDLITTSTNSGNVYVMMGNGNGTFQPAQAYQALAPQGGDNISVKSVTVVDFGSPAGPGTPDGHLDLVVTAAPQSGGAAEVIFMPGLVDGNGNFAGFASAAPGSPVAPTVLATVGAAGPIVAGDFQGNGVTDLAVGSPGGVTIIYGAPLNLAPITAPSAARKLGDAAHLIMPAQAIVSNHADAYFAYTVPTEPAPDTGAQVVDISTLFQNVTGSGLTLSVTLANGQPVQILQSFADPTSGARERVLVPQGDQLLIHVAGADANSFGVYTLDVDVLPQIVGAEAEGPVPGGDDTSIVVTLGGDLLDPTQAENPANYVVYQLDANGNPVGAPLALSTVSGAQPIVYDASASIQVVTGRYYPTQVQQTITLDFAQPLTAGDSYLVELSPLIDTASLGAQENSLLVDAVVFSSHPLVGVTNGNFELGGEITVTATPQSGNLSAGTPFLSQLHDDLGAQLNSYLAASGDSPQIPTALTDEILARFVPGWVASGGNTPYLILWLDPVSIQLADPDNNRTVFDLKDNSVANGISHTYFEVGGNVEVMVVAAVAGTYRLDVADVAASSRGGAILLDGAAVQTVALTAAMRDGTQDFLFSFAQSAITSGDRAGSESNGVTTALLDVFLNVAVNLQTLAGTSLTVSTESDGAAAEQTEAGAVAIYNFGAVEETELTRAVARWAERLVEDGAVPEVTDGLMNALQSMPLYRTLSNLLGNRRNAPRPQQPQEEGQQGPRQPPQPQQRQQQPAEPPGGEGMANPDAVDPKAGANEVGRNEMPHVPAALAADPVRVVDQRRRFRELLITCVFAIGAAFGLAPERSDPDERRAKGRRVSR